MMRSLKQGVFRSFVYQLNFDYLYTAVTMISARLETVNQVLQQKQLDTLLEVGRTVFFFLNGLNSSSYRFNKVPEAFLRDFGQHWLQRLVILPSPVASTNHFCFGTWCLLDTFSFFGPFSVKPSVVLTRST